MLRVIMDRTEQGTSRTFRLASTLFPVLQCSQCNIYTLGEFGLREPRRLTNLFHLKGIDVELTRWLTLAAVDLIHLSHTFHETIKETFFHYFHPLLSSQSCAFCRSVNVSIIPFL